MNSDIEELRFVADLAHSGGMMQAENEHLKKDNAKLQTENEQLKTDCERLQGEMGELQLLLKQLEGDIRLKKDEIESLRKQNLQAQGQQPRVVVNNFYMLSVPKTHEYVCKLDNDGRRFVGHFMHHTLDDTQRSVIDEVDEMTQLEHHDEGHVVIQHNNGPVNGYITTQHVEMPALNADTTKMIENDE
jgi:hypothetical protein